MNRKRNRIIVKHMSNSFFFIYCRKFFDNQSIILHGRNVETLERQAFFINDFYPRIGVEATEKNQKKILAFEKKGLILYHELFYKDDQSRMYYDQFDRHVIVIYLKSTADVNVIRTQFEVTHQDDVPYERVLKIFLGIHSGFVILDWENISKQNKIALPGNTNKKFADLFKNYLLVSHNDIIGF